MFLCDARRFGRRALSAIAVVSISAALVPAAPRKGHPIFVDPKFTSDAIDVVYVLPTVDIRSKKEQEPEQTLKSVDSSVLHFLRRRGYETVPDDPKLGGHSHSPILFSEPPRSNVQQPTHPVRMEISEADLKEPRESWAKEFGPDNARWVLLVALEDSGSHLTFGSSGDVIVLGTLFYKASGQMVWRGVAAGSGAPDKAIQDAVRDLCSQIAKKSNLMPQVIQRHY
jgi:hypothetical protein